MNPEYYKDYGPFHCEIGGAKLRKITFKEWIELDHLFCAQDTCAMQALSKPEVQS